MKKIKNIIVLFLVCVWSYAQQTPAPKQKESILIMGAIAHLGNGKVINNSIISIINGKIALIGDATLIKPVKHDKTIIANGKHVYPGFIAPNSTLGLVEIDAVRASDDEREIGEFNPHIRSLIAYNTESVVTETTRPNGILLAQITPRGGRISGTSSIVHLDAWNWEDAVIKKDEGIHLNWPRSYVRKGWWAEPGGIEMNKKYTEQIEEIEKFFINASAYLASKKEKRDIPYEAMNGVFDDQKKVYIHVDGEKEIMDVIQFKKKFNLNKVVIIGGFYAFKVVDELKREAIPILLRRVHDLPLLEDEDVNLPYKNAVILVQNGITVGLENAGDMERMQTRNLPFYAGTCAAWGLDKETALQLITFNTAKILGIDQNYGTLENGKSATLFISDGDALDMKSNTIIHAFIDGREISLKSHQTELYERYKEKYNRK